MQMLLNQFHKEHIHETTPPCSICPRGGVCVPKVQCPAHTRPHSYNPRCHINKEHIGVCCFTGNRLAAEADRKFRAAVNIPELKEVHNISRQRLLDWMERATILSDKDGTIVQDHEPSYGHHLSMTFNKKANILGQSGLVNLFAAQELRDRQALSDHELALGLTDHLDGTLCPIQPSCPTIPSKYRSIDGSCNNPQQASWGASHTGYERLLPPDYRDGTWSFRLSVTGNHLPSAREVSSVLIPDAHQPSRSHNLMFMQFGHLLAYDVTSGVVFSTANGSGISCCSQDGTALPIELQHWACAAIPVADTDPFYKQFHTKCLNFVRTQLAPWSDCSVGYAKQMNGVTHYPDLSPIYGSSLEKLNSLRAPGGLLKTFHDFGRELPPLTQKPECLVKSQGAVCFDSGDNHGNQIISLTVLNTLFIREHNRVARELSLINPKWDDDKVFFEARRIVQAEFQNIIYKEWLPLLLGPKVMKLFKITSPKGYSTGYDSLVNPSLTVEFAAAAMRFGHSTVDGKMMVLSPKSGETSEVLSIPEVMFQPSRMRLKPFLDRMLMGMSWQPMQNVDPFMTESLTQYMFHGGNPSGLDLAALNIQRGRDYGLRNYNDYRKLVGLMPLDFTDFSPNTAKRLTSVYKSPQDIDLWVGGLLEKPLEGAIVGPTFAQILADQFARIKNGDRYFYDYGPDVNPGAFTISQLAEIKKVTMSRIICDNSDHIELNYQSPNAFLRSDMPGNEPVPCDSPLIPELDLRIMKEI
ncbi:unnamed protein product [Colias eurytheme]|nr:unnamed protein product [Colias eurytheme]